MSRYDKLWRGVFNYHGEQHELFTKANFSGQAKTFMITRLARNLGLNRWVLENYFCGTKDNFSVKLHKGGE